MAWLWVWVCWASVLVLASMRVLVPVLLTLLCRWLPMVRWAAVASECVLVRLALGLDGLLLVHLAEQGSAGLMLLVGLVRLVCRALETFHSSCHSRLKMRQKKRAG
jgi:hypothetical protein